ncbi:fibrinogen C domain-containing protein 1-like [Toxorhynchites rutilus septentrionalis]|uniref:fibrinogen C domain-containing protein 1-like n=1 Tax=Toxorhynchites rutilus septentrionalis TaxID=329112 RepID=UPI00247AD48A|nr:fibrinogen C domain-containing protein 1-like [Toxorhynchites rutilus septentrionalis]
MITIGLKAVLILVFLLLEQATCLNRTNNARASPQLVTDCTDASPVTNGVYRIQTSPHTEPFPVLCIRRKDNREWMVIQQRFDGSIDFQRNWQDYRDGFGDVSDGGEFWLGLQKIHDLTSSAAYELAVEMTDFIGAYRFGLYSSFVVGSEEEQFPLKSLGQYSGDVDCISAHLGKKFTTFDNDNDGFPEWNCAVRHQGAWWYDRCYLNGSNLNGLYRNAASDLAITCINLGSPLFKGLKQTRLLIRKRQL